MVTCTFKVFSSADPSGFVLPEEIFTSISTTRLSSPGFQSSTFGVPIRFPLLSTRKPFWGLVVVMVTPGLLMFSITLVFSGTPLCSITLVPVFGVAVTSSHLATVTLTVPFHVFWLVLSLRVSVIEIVFSVSPSAHVMPSGVPTTLPKWSLFLSVSTLSPFTVVLVSSNCGRLDNDPSWPWGTFCLITTLVLVYGFFSSATGAGVSTIPTSGYTSLLLGLGSSSLLNPSPSISESFLSGIPSPSVSRRTVTKVETCFVSASLSKLTLTEILTLRSVSPVCQSSIEDIPLRWPSTSTYNPSCSSAFVLVMVPVVFTTSAISTFAPLVTVGFLVNTVCVDEGCLSLSLDPSLSLTSSWPSLSSSQSVISGSPSPSVSRRTLTTTTDVFVLPS